MRRPFAFLLLLCICWQSLAYAGVGTLVVEGEELAHAVLHFEGKAHHHDDHDGSFHQDESTASVQHAMHDACSFSPALLTGAVLPVLPTYSTPPVDARNAEPPLLFLSGPERPPKSLI
jgi:hypothetical protein